MQSTFDRAKNARMGVRDIGRGTKAFDAAPVRGAWRMLETPDDVLALMDGPMDGLMDGLTVGPMDQVVAGVQDAGATFLAPIFDDLAAVICFSGTPQSHIGIVSREYQVPCIMATQLDGDRPADGTLVEVDCSGDDGVLRTL